MTQKIKYNNNPLPPNNNKHTKATRIKIGSILKYLPNPPHTPAILRSEILRVNFL